MRLARQVSLILFVGSQFIGLRLLLLLEFLDALCNLGLSCHGFQQSGETSNILLMAFQFLFQRLHVLEFGKDIAGRTKPHGHGIVLINSVFDSGNQLAQPRDNFIGVRECDAGSTDGQSKQIGTQYAKELRYLIVGKVFPQGCDGQPAKVLDGFGGCFNFVLCGLELPPDRFSGFV